MLQEEPCSESLLLILRDYVTKAAHYQLLYSSFFQITNSDTLLAPIKPNKAGRKCVVIDLDETLVHSSFRVRVQF